MRRGHQGAGGGGGGGWRDGPRHFRPRGGPGMHYRGFAPPNLPRFPPPGPRFTRPSYGPGPGPGPRFDNAPPQGRGRYGNRSIFSHIQRMRQPPPEPVIPYPHTPFHADDDLVDDPYSHGQAAFARPSPWADNQMFYENQDIDFAEDPKVIPHRNPAGFAGHRPPASDHYGSNAAATNDNSDTFSRSIDDTVDIVRQKLKRRGESRNSTDNASNVVQESESKTKHDKSNESPVRQLTTARKKMQRLRNVKANCDQLKNKIVHQLFKMDKDRIHKLMDNPNSSSKFEYALSSLITESQNSYNRHLRSMAEKSLCGPSTALVNYDNNTIYEDTFMKQMQCILDPQDTVLLEDLKPLVLAELSKVLQLGDLDQGQGLEEQPAYPPREQSYYEDDVPVSDLFANVYPFNSFTPANDEGSRLDQRPNQSSEFHTDRTERKPLFERRSAFKSPDSSSKKDHRYSHRTQEHDKSSQEDHHTNSVPRQGSDRGSYEDRNTNRTPSDVSCSSEGTIWGRRTSSRDEPLWGSKIESEDRIRNRSPNPADRFVKIKGSKSPIPEERFSDSKATVTENRLLESNVPTPNTVNRLTRSKTPPPEDRFMGNKTPIPEDKSIGSNSPLPENIFMGCKSPASEYRFEESTSLALPVFDANTADLSDDDGAFAELDRQYHVAVDRNFITNFDLTSPPDEFTRSISKSPVPVVSPPKPKSPEKPQKVITIKLPTAPAQPIDNDINNQLLDMAKSPLKLVNPAKILEQQPVSEAQFKAEARSPDSISSHAPSNSSEKSNSKESITIKQEPLSAQNTTPVTDKTTPSNSHKRSIDQKPSHRKEKRKKIELPPETSNKQILNKNIIINVNDCAGKSSEKCDAPKSIFNLFFAKEKSGKDSPKDVKRNDSSDKHVKRKDNKEKEPSKKREKESDDQKKTNSNTIIQSTQSSQAPNTPVKEENKVKLKPIDMFENCNKKPNVIRLIDGQKKTPVTIIDNVKLGIGRKLTKRHVGTQVVRKICTKETQTPASKSCNCKDRKRSVTQSAQTEPVTFKNTCKVTDPFERMKEIDIEIQVLLQEKFMLYSSMESKEPCPSAMHTLGMTVLNDDTKAGDVPDLEDAIVDEFANIPVEELEQIALESVSAMPISPVKSKKKKSERRRHKSPTPVKSPISTRNKKKNNTPNISLIEQIITDDRPLEDIISLDELEVKPTKKKNSKKTQPKKSQVQKTPKKQVHKKGSILRRMMDVLEYGIKDCCIVLKREDLTKYMNKEQRMKTAKHKLQKKLKTPEKIPRKEKEKVKEKSPETTPAQEQAVDNAVMEVVNDIQFDMLDVSEDIVIGESCEVKSTEEKINSSSTICEDIILDNSQSSVEDAEVPIVGATESECKLFDFSADELLKRDSITVSGNADAVLAIEIIDNNFIAACLDGNVYYFSGEGQLINTLRGSNLAVTCLCIVREKHGITVYTGSLDSRIRYYDLETGLEKGPEGNVLSPIQTMDRAWDTIFVGTRTGFVLQFECKNNMLIPVSTVKFSDQSILALRAMKEGPRKVLLVAARSEPVTIKDAQSGLLLRTLEGPKMTVYTLLFEDGKVYCGTSNHQIHVFDYVSGGHVGVHEGGKGAVCLRAAGGLVFAGCYDGCVYVYREGQPRPLAQLRGPGLMLLSLAVIGSKIIAGYKDRSLYIWRMPEAILNEMIL